VRALRVGPCVHQQGNGEGASKYDSGQELFAHASRFQNLVQLPLPSLCPPRRGTVRYATTALHPDECEAEISFCGLFDSFQTCFGMFTSSHGTLSSNRNLFTRDMVYLYPTHYK
jgi:hypothetical protein